MRRPKEDEEAILDLLEAASPTAPTHNIGFRDVHNEMVALQNVARVFINIAVSSLDDGAYCGVEWSSFFSVPSPHRLISKQDQIENFLLSKKK